MSIKIELVEGTGDLESLFIADLEKLLNAVLAEYDFAGGEVAVAIGSDQLLRRLNRKYRAQDKTTDVLSFCYLEPGEGIPVDGSAFALGDIYISIDRALAQAAENGHSLNRELALLSIHGLLHILGFDHGGESAAEQMKNKEVYYLKRLDLAGRRSESDV